MTIKNILKNKDVRNQSAGAIKKRIIEENARELLAKEKQLSELHDIIIDLSHELIALNARIKDTAKKLENAIDNHDSVWIEKYRKTISGLCYLSNSRMELFQFQISPDNFIAFDNENVAIYRVIDKISKSIKDSDFGTSTNINLRNNSNKRFSTKKIVSLGFYILIDNARKYTCQNKPILIDFHESGNSLKIMFSNWGPSISAEERCHLAERGFRGRSAKKIKPKNGHGLGLSIAKNIFDICGVKMEFEFSDIIIYPGDGDIPYSEFKVILTFYPVIE